MCCWRSRCSAKTEALGRSKGGFTNKIHAITDAPGNPLDFILTGGQASDIGQAEILLALTTEGAAALVGDKGYDSDAFIQTLTEKAIEPVIAPRSNRINPRDCDWFTYKERDLMECFFNKIKHYKRISPRYEKLARNYMGFIRFVSALIWLR
ncbi:IS5 family transposase [Nitrosomonas sp. Nm34]|uniref:IS5 family transposase n=1 Tax=Nitrosomonas sp. Nm34 TaxID=1881055 RepID=UPI0008E43DCA|nr:IS5 family transposase [Nitrosomonas sp. Nm34]SFI74731.1 Transposase [Nitrosomonas sp. Nm34]